MRRLRLALLSAILGLTLDGTAANTYTNPVLTVDTPDPSVIKADDGYYYLYATGEGIYRSSDLVSWQYIRAAFQGKTRPSFVSGAGGYWAPCITHQGDQYVLYFALSAWGGESTASIGVATSSSPSGPFDLVGDGKLFSSSEIGVQNSIDPNYIEYNGSKYVMWGSWHGIWLVELTSDGLAVKDMNVKTQIAGTAFEAPYIYKRGDYYYLFCSIGACCEGENSTYKTVYGRSTSPFGPFVNKAGGRMLDNQYNILLESNSAFVGPGHNSRIVEDANGETWMFYHAYERGNADVGRQTLMDKVRWDGDGWPYIEGGPTSTERVAPKTSMTFMQPIVADRTWGYQYGNIVPADLTGDGRKELLIGAFHRYGTNDTRFNTILQTDGAGNWSEMACPFDCADRPSITPCDINGDGILDVVLFETLGRNVSDALFQSHTTTEGIYLGVGDGTFVEAPMTIVDATDGLPAHYAKAFGDDPRCIVSGAVADFNNDGLPDIVGVGINENNVVLLNQGDMKFKPIYFDAGTDEGGNGRDLECAMVLTADFNNDGYADILVSANENGSPNAGADRARFMEIYLNDGTGTHFERTRWAAECPSVSNGGVAIADFNNDGYLDIFCQGPGGFWPGTDYAQQMMGNTSDGYWDHTYVLYNDGTGTHFTIAPLDTFDRLDLRNQNSTTGGANAFDWNGDNRIDIIYQGWSPELSTQTGYIWTNSFSGKFTSARRFAGGSEAATCIVDWTGNGLKDIVSTGFCQDGHFLDSSNNGRTLTVTENTERTTSAPKSPVDLTAEVDGSQVRLSWSPASGAPKNITYELYIRDANGTLLGNCRAFVDGDDDGLRKVEDFGNVGCATSLLYTLPDGTYTWGVQAVNGRRVGSPFAQGEAFTIGQTDGIGQAAIRSPRAFNVYAIDGRIVRRGSQTAVGLPKGVYVVNGKKMVVE